MFWFGWITFTLVAITSIPAVAALKLKKLRLSDARKDQWESLPSVSVIVPARNEEAQIRNALEGLLRSECIRIEIIAVDDRSTDATGRIMDEVAAGDSRVRVIHVEQLPEGWLGKNHAMHVGSQAATGKLILFTDGDILFEPLALNIAVQHFQNRGLQHLTMLPKMVPGSLIENVVVTFFGLAFSIGMQLHLIRTRWPMSYAGVGAFNMVDAAFYRKLGGHQSIAMDVLDDVKLGKMIKRNGGQIDFQLAEHLLSVRWQHSLWGVVTGLEKNGFASLNYSIVQMAGTSVLHILIFLLPWLMPLLLPIDTSSGFLATAILWHSIYGWMVWPLPGSWTLIPFFLCGPWIMAFAFWRSAWITLRQGGVRWRDSFYPLSTLRKTIY